MDESKDVNAKALAVLKIADKWAENHHRHHNSLSQPHSLNDFIMRKSPSRNTDVHEKSPRVTVEVIYFVHLENVLIVN